MHVSLVARSCIRITYGDGLAVVSSPMQFPYILRLSIRHVGDPENKCKIGQGKKKKNIEEKKINNISFPNPLPIGSYNAVRKSKKKLFYYEVSGCRLIWKVVIFVCLLKSTFEILITKYIFKGFSTFLKAKDQKGTFNKCNQTHP